MRTSKKGVQLRILDIAPIRSPFVEIWNLGDVHIKTSDYNWRYEALEALQQFNHNSSDQFPLHESDHVSDFTLHLYSANAMPDISLSVTHAYFDKYTGRLSSGEFLVQAYSLVDSSVLFSSLFHKALKTTGFHFPLVTSKIEIEPGLFRYSALLDGSGSPEERFLFTFEFFQELANEMAKHSALGL